MWTIASFLVGVLVGANIIVAWAVCRAAALADEAAEAERAAMLEDEASEGTWILGGRVL